jgi:hypothetical protein
MGRSYEEELIKKIEAGIRALRLRTKEPRDTGCAVALNKLKEINVGMYDEYLQKYKNALAEYNHSKS